MTDAKHDDESTLIAIAHGSRNPAWRESIERQFEKVQEAVESTRVLVSYMELAPPTLMEATKLAVRDGARRVRVLPLFLAAEGHVLRDIEPLVDELRRAFPSIEVELLRPLGQQPLFVDLLKSLVDDAIS